MSLPQILAWRLDTVLFVALALATFAVSVVVIRKKQSAHGHHFVTILLMVITVAAGVWASAHAEHGEREQIRSLVAGLAPTFAHELSSLGHEKITADTKPDDPLYISLIEREKDWLRLNPNVADIYTYRRAPDGKLVFIVDSETDYNHDGRFEGEREERTPIGYPYENASDKTVRALAGEAVFDTDIVADEWGLWISFDQPMYDANGHVEAVLGIDFPAEKWLTAILFERALPLIIAYIFFLVVIISSTLICLMRSEIEERKRTEIALRESRIEADRANRSKSEFLAAMSHEIRTPMNSLIGFSNLLIDTPLTPEQRDYTVTLRSSAHSLLALLNDILDLSKIEAGRTQIEQIPFAVNEAVSSVITLLKPRANDKNLEFTVDDNSGDLKLVGDPHRFRQILMNLVSNAVKFTEKGTISISVHWLSTTTTTGVLRCDVTDTGIGIPSDMVRQLFQKFSQADASTTRRYGGTGLGLAISRELTQLMGGTLTVKSEFGYGSTFTLQLPATMHEGPLNVAPAPVIGRSGSPFINGQIPQPSLAPDKTVVTPTPLAAISAPPPLMMPVTLSPTAKPAVKVGSAGCILMVEDNPTNRKLGSIMLEKFGYAVDIATNGREALDKVFTQRYHAVLMDCEMPELDGFEATREIRAREKVMGKRHHIPVIALTANAMEGEEEKCLAAGMDLFLTKPIKPDALREALNRFPANSGSMM